MKYLHSLLGLALASHLTSASEFHVSVQGNDRNDGSCGEPIQNDFAAARIAQPGDVITVHEGTYRERVTPPRRRVGCHTNRYQAANGQKVEIKGSEVIKKWVKVQNDVWKVTLPNSFFRRFHPIPATSFARDWFNRGRDHHTGAVYRNARLADRSGQLQEVICPQGRLRRGSSREAAGYLLNVAWLRPAVRGQGMPVGFRQPALRQERHAECPLPEGGECIGFIEQGTGSL